MLVHLILTVGNEEVKRYITHIAVLSSIEQQISKTDKNIRVETCDSVTCLSTFQQI